MRLLATILFAIFTSNSIAQDANIFERTWYLYEVQSTDLGTYYDVSEIDRPIQPFIFINSDFSYNGEGACNTFDGNYDYIEQADEFSSQDFEETGNDCSSFDYNDFEQEYFSFITAWAYEITQDGSNFTLSLENGLFGFAELRSVPLSTNDITLRNLKIFPNPAQDVINIESENLEGQLHYNIVDVEGRIIEERDLDGNTIDVSGLASGVYMLKLQTENGAVETRKFVKK